MSAAVASSNKAAADFQAGDYQDAASEHELAANEFQGAASLATNNTDAFHAERDSMQEWANGASAAENISGASANDIVTEAGDDLNQAGLDAQGIIANGWSPNANASTDVVNDLDSVSNSLNALSSGDQNAAVAAQQTVNTNMAATQTDAGSNFANVTTTAPVAA